MRKELSQDDPECKEQKYVWGSGAAHQLNVYLKSKNVTKQKRLSQNRTLNTTSACV